MGRLVLVMVTARRRYGLIIRAILDRREGLQFDRCCTIFIWGLWNSDLPSSDQDITGVFSVSQCHNIILCYKERYLYHFNQMCLHCALYASNMWYNPVPNTSNPSSRFYLWFLIVIWVPSFRIRNLESERKSLLDRTESLAAECARRKTHESGKSNLHPRRNTLELASVSASHFK